MPRGGSDPLKQYRDEATNLIRALRAMRERFNYVFESDYQPAGADIDRYNEDLERMKERSRRLADIRRSMPDELNSANREAFENIDNEIYSHMGIIADIGDVLRPALVAGRRRRRRKTFRKRTSSKRKWNI